MVTVVEVMVTLVLMVVEASVLMWVMGFCRYGGGFRGYVDAVMVIMVVMWVV